MPFTVTIKGRPDNRSELRDACSALGHGSVRRYAEKRDIPYHSLSRLLHGLAKPEYFPEILRTVNKETRATNDAWLRPGN